jgi:hypothetical protein
MAAATGLIAPNQVAGSVVVVVVGGCCCRGCSCCWILLVPDTFAVWRCGVRGAVAAGLQLAHVRAHISS